MNKQEFAQNMCLKRNIFIYLFIFYLFIYELTLYKIMHKIHVYVL